MRQRYKDSTKRPKAKENQARILKMYPIYPKFCQKIQHKTSGPGESAAGVMYP